MFQRLKWAVACSLAIGLSIVAQGAAIEAAELASGSYELRLVTPQMAKGKQDIALPAEVEVTKQEVVIKTQGMTGNKITLRGLMNAGSIKVGVTEVEKSSILSFHYIGKVQTPQQAQGKFHCFIDGKAVFAGEWVLTKKK